MKDTAQSRGLDAAAMLRAGGEVEVGEVEVDPGDPGRINTTVTVTPPPGGCQIVRAYDADGNHVASEAVAHLDPEVERAMAKLAAAMDAVQQRWQDADARDRWTDDGGR